MVAFGATDGTPADGGVGAGLDRASLEGRLGPATPPRRRAVGPLVSRAMADMALGRRLAHVVGTFGATVMPTVVSLAALLSIVPASPGATGLTILPNGSAAARGLLQRAIHGARCVAK